MSSRVCNNCSMQVSENAKFCSGCGSDLTLDSTISKKQNPPSVIKSAKKGFGIGVKIGLGVGIIFFLILIAGAIVGSSNTSTTTGSNINNQQPITLQEQRSSSNNSASQDTITNDEIISKVEGHQAITASNTGSTQSSSSNNSSPDKFNGEPITADQMISFIQNYRGPNDNGPMLESILTNYITNNFGNGPKGLGEAMATEQWLALEPTNSFGLWKVEHIMDIQKNIYIWEWDVNTTNHKIYAVDQSAQAILNGVENP